MKYLRTTYLELKNKQASSYFVGFKPFNGRKLTFYIDRELKGGSK